jgi:hypothetical protein
MPSALPSPTLVRAPQRCQFGQMRSRNARRGTCALLPKKPSGLDLVRSVDPGRGARAKRSGAVERFEKPRAPTSGRGSFSSPPTVRGVRPLGVAL